MSRPTPLVASWPVSAIRPDAAPGPGKLTITPAGGILFLVVICAIYVARPILLPIAIAILLSFLLAPVVRALGHCFLPRSIATALLLSVLVGGMGLSAYQLSGPAALWMKRLPASIPQLENKLSSIRQPMERMDAAAQQVAHLTSSATPNSPPQVTIAASMNWESHLMSMVQSSALEFLITLITLAFLLASGGTILERLVKMLPMDGEHPDPLRMLLPFSPDSALVLRDTERQVCLYLAVSSLINCLFGLVLAVGWYCMGLPNPILWGVVAAVLNFLPYIGPMIGVPLIALVALLSFDTWHQALLPPLLYGAVAFAEGNLITPLTIGRNLAMSPLAIFVSTVFWGWLWGFPGALIAVPMLVMIKEFCRRLPALAPLTTLIEP